MPNLRILMPEGPINPQGTGCWIAAVVLVAVAVCALIWIWPW